MKPMTHQGMRQPASRAFPSLARAGLAGPTGALLAAVLLLGAGAAQAVELTAEGSELKFRWDNTVRYSAAARLLKASSVLLSNVNQDDGDRNFSRGLISNRVDLLSEADLSYKNVGARISGAAWYDAVYNRANQNYAPATVNTRSVAFNEFTETTRNLAGRKAELLDAFVFGRGQIGDTAVSGRLGRHSVLWGESLFFGNNGVAGTQAAVDVIKAVSVPSSTFKEIIRPDDQISGVLQLNANLSVAAYYKFGWEKNRLPPAGSYFANGDLVNGGERLFQGPPAAMWRVGDFEPKESGQGGLSLKWRPADTDLDLGFYAVRYHDRNPSLYLYPGVGITNPAARQIGIYRLAYAQGIETYGVSANTAIGPVSLAGEASIRRNAALATDPQLTQVGPADNDQNPRYAVGNTAHINLSALWNVAPSFIAQESAFAAELAWNRTLHVSKNPTAKAIFSERDALGLRMIYTPTYRQVLPGVDLSVPMGLSYFPKGRSSAVGGFGVDKGGDYSLGVSGAYLDVWRFSLAFTGYYGPEGTFLGARPGGGPNVLSFQQSLKDRNFLALSLSRTL